MRSQRGFVLACALIGTLALAGSAAADTDIQGNLARSAGPRRPLREARADRRAEVRRQGAPRRRGVERVRHAVVARAARRGPGREGPRRDAGAARAGVAAIATGRCSAWLARRASHRSATRAGRERHPRHHAAPDARRARRVRRRSRDHRRREGRERVEGRVRASTISGDETLAAGREAVRRPGVAARGDNVGHNLAGPGHPHRHAQARPRPGLEGPARRRPLRRPALAPVAFPTVSRGYVPAFETLVLDTRRPSRPRTACSSTPAAAPCSPARTSSTTRGDDAGRPRRPTTPTPSTARCRAQDGAATRTRARSPSPPATASARSTCFANADPPGERHRPPALRTARARSPQADTVRTPERIRYAPAGGSPGRLHGRGLRVRGRQRAGRAAHLHRHVRARRLRPAGAVHRALACVHGQPAADALAHDPWNNPSTDTRQNWCWEQSTTPSDCDRVVGNPASRAPWDFDPQTERADLHDARQQRAHGRVVAGRQPARAPDQFQPFERRPRLHVPVDERVVHEDCNPARRRPASRSARASTSPRR